MKEQWKEEFELLFEKNTEIDAHNVVNGLTCDRDTRHIFIAFIERLLEEQRRDQEILVNTILDTRKKELIEQILKDAPEDMTVSPNRDANGDAQAIFYNLANEKWRELINNLI